MKQGKVCGVYVRVMCVCVCARYCRYLMFI